MVDIGGESRNKFNFQEKDGKNSSKGAKEELKSLSPE